MEKSDSNEVLLKRIAARDVSALEEFYDRHHRFVYALVLRIVNEPNQAEEVVLEIFWQIWQQADHFSPGRLRATTWLTMVSRDRALDHLGRMPSRPSPIAEERRHFSRSAPPAPGPESIEMKAAAREALDSLTAVQRQALEMAYYRGLDPREIAAALHEPASLVKSRIVAGLNQIRAAMRRWAPSDGASGQQK